MQTKPLILTLTLSLAAFNAAADGAGIFLGRVNRIAVLLRPWRLRKL